MKGLGGMVAAVALAASACGGGGSGGASPAPGPSTGGPTVSAPGPTASSTGPSPAPTEAGLTYDVWFACHKALFVSSRSQAPTLAVARAALTAMLSGPNTAEAAAGVKSTIPNGTRLLGLSISSGRATVDLSKAYGSGSASAHSLRPAQIVYTLTQFSTVRSVVIQQEGAPAVVTNGQGVVLHRPVTRKDYVNLLPPILVRSPTIGQTVSSPVTVFGSANVFEATVTMRVLDQHGNVVGTAQAMAACGTGCRGGYRKQMTYSMSSSQPGTVEVYEVSPKDGSHEHVQRIPVTLTP
jgi:hypothetical protein